MPKKKATILIIDDEPDIQFIISRTLQLEGYHTFQAGGGESGLEILRGNGVVDLLLLDLTLPGIDGWEVFSEMKKDPELSKIPVIICSATATIHWRNEAIKLGASDYLVKPTGSRELKAAVANALKTSGRNCAAKKNPLSKAKP